MNKTKFKFGFYLKKPEFNKAYNHIENLSNENQLFMRGYQENNLKKLIHHVVSEVPYYKDTFYRLGLEINDFNTVEDLTKLPILTKEMIKSDPEYFIAKKFAADVVNGSTGGSTGVPLKYIMSNYDHALGTALLFKGFEFGGYKLGDSMAIIAGSSLVNKNQTFKSKLQDWIMNAYHFSSYGMGEDELTNFNNILNKKKPKFLRGYATSLYILAKHIYMNKLEMRYNFTAIFSTSEKLLTEQRYFIEKVFNTKVYDNYGLHDGGISAFECKLHNGMHIDFERSILEVTNSVGDRQLIEEKGKILATSLFNYAMPFIRYDTGDLGIITNEICKCGNNKPRILEISGRETDYIKINGVYIGSPVLTVLMGKVNAESYQIVQQSENSILIKILKSENYSIEDEMFIINSLKIHVADIIIKFEYVEHSTDIFSNTTKHKFIINNEFK